MGASISAAQCSKSEPNSELLEGSREPRPSLSVEQLDFEPRPEVFVSLQLGQEFPRPGCLTSSSAMMRARSGDVQNR